MAGAASAMAALTPTPSDLAMHSWCEDMGVQINPAAKLITTPKSVAGRGVFAVDEIFKDEVVAAIPTFAMFHSLNAEHIFPDVARGLLERMQCASEENHQQTKKSQLGRLVRRFLQRRQRTEPQMDHNFLNAEERPWQAELTEYATAVLNEEHPLAPWIRQWHRDDPVHQLFQNGGKTRT